MYVLNHVYIYSHKIPLINILKSLAVTIREETRPTHVSFHLVSQF
jgi:hypothetical protein